MLINFRVFFSCEPVFYYRGLSEELRRVEGTLFVLPCRTSEFAGSTGHEPPCLCADSELALLPPLLPRSARQQHHPHPHPLASRVLRSLCYRACVAVFSPGSLQSRGQAHSLPCTPPSTEHPQPPARGWAHAHRPASTYYLVKF